MSLILQRLPLRLVLQRQPAVRSSLVSDPIFMISNIKPSLVFSPPADMYVPASDGESVGVIESKDGGNTLTFTDVGETLGMAIAMATAASESDKSVVVGGLFGAGYSLDSGATWQKLGGIEAATTQDVKYEPNSGLYAITGNILGKPSVAVSASASTNFTTIEVCLLSHPH